MKKTALVLALTLFLSCFLCMVPVVKADVGELLRASAFTLHSPLNKTYNSRFLTLNLTFMAGLGDSYSFYYYLDGKHQGSIPFVVHNPHELHVFYKASGSTQLPELSEGAHSLAVTQLATTYTPHQTVRSSTAKFTIDTTMPNILSLSMENKTYDTTKVPFILTTNEPVQQIAYSLDKQANVTVVGNTTLTDLFQGSHNIIVYASDNAGKIGTSETIYFSVDVPLPTTLVIASVCVDAIIAIAVLVYFKKRRSEAKPS